MQGGALAYQVLSFNWEEEAKRSEDMLASYRPLMDESFSDDEEGGGPPSPGVAGEAAQHGGDSKAD